MTIEITEKTKGLWFKNVMNGMADILFHLYEDHDPKIQDSRFNIVFVIMMLMIQAINLIAVKNEPIFKIQGF